MKLTTAVEANPIVETDGNIFLPLQRLAARYWAKAEKLKHNPAAKSAVEYYRVAAAQVIELTR